jgi:hypothetical protein
MQSSQLVRRIRTDKRPSYAITFPKGQVPPVKGFWSVTLYNQYHFFNNNPLKRYSLGTKNKNLKYNEDGSLTLYAGAKSSGSTARPKPPSTRVGSPATSNL